jgi:nucleoside-diphosphate-sugar epimerase
VVVGDLDAHADWSAALEGVDIVIHAAARAHRPGDTVVEPYLEVNARATLRLARAAAQAGVSRFVYLSSIKVNGDGRPDRPYSPADEARPGDAYARSKWLGEQYLQEVAAGSTLRGVVVRPPLVYGPGVRGNFLRLLQWVQTGRPIPLGAVHNARSLVSVWNLCDLLTVLVEHAAAGGRTWLVADGEDISTPELVRRIARAMGRPARLLAVPRPLLAAAARLTGLTAEFARLCGSLTVDSTATRAELGWSAPLPLTDGIARTVEWHLAGGRAHGT